MPGAPYQTRLRVARADIFEAFTKLDSRILTLEQLSRLLDANRDAWRLGNITLQRFVELAEQTTPLRTVSLQFPYRPATRFIWGDATNFELVQSLHSAGYFSHYSAMQLNGLTQQVPKTIYFNIEQRMRPGGGSLSQEGINRAFKGRCRTSSNIATYRDRSICLLNGGNTDQLGAERIDAPEGDSQIRVTNLERTLIDATIRPVYSGGVYEVLGAFTAAKDRASVNKLSAMLKKLGYTYPYHQAIGFYLERAGYRQSQLALLRKFKIEFDFYLDYSLKQVEYDSRWRIYFPQGF